MGKFINKSYSNTIDSLSSGMIQKVKSANYTFNNKSPVLCHWYNIDKEATTLGEDSGLHYSEVGKTSPFRFKLIKDAIFYAQGIQIELDLEYDEDGLSTAPPQITGIVLPNTWIPYQGDYFYINQIGKDYLYRVNSVGYDTIENGNNMYKFDAAIDQTGQNYISNQVTDNYKMIINNVGTSFNAVVQEEVYDTISSLDDSLLLLKDNFTALFYDDKVQTFTYNGPYGKLYDPFMIEFIMRNDILKGSTEYIYVHHEVPVPRTFSIEYDNTLYRGLELKKKNKFSTNSCIAAPIDNQYSLFSTVAETYFSIKYNGEGGYRFCPISGELISKVKSNTEFDEQDEDSFMNIVIKYMNNSDINSNILSLIESIEYKPTVDMFYFIPMLIYVIESSVKKMMS